MARSKLERLVAQRNERQPLTTSSNFANYSADELRQAIYDNRQQAGSDGGSAMMRNNMRAALLERAGVDYYSIDDIEPNPDNGYSMDEKSIEGLADLIYESKATTPLFLVETSGPKLKIIDGERRYRAHQLLRKRYGEAWSMVPAQRFRKGEISEDDVSFMLNALNIGQRAMTESERAKGFAAIADRLLAQRREGRDPGEGRRIAEVMAEQFGVSARTANMEINIGRNLTEEGMTLLDGSGITKVAADALARLPPERQREIAEMVESGKLDKADVTNEIKRRSRRSARLPKSTDEHLIEARRSIKRALALSEQPDRMLVAELKNLLDKFSV